MEENLELINDLVRESFGRRWKGNYMISEAGFGDLKLGEVPFPNIIGKRGWFREYRAGRLSNEGQSIHVHPDYKEQGEKYARLYEETTGHPSDVIVSDDFVCPEAKKAIEEDDKFLEALGGI